MKKLEENQKKFYNLGWKYRACSEDVRYYKWIVEIIKDFVKSGRLLDVACGEGIFLKEAENGFETYGIDISEVAIRRAKSICKKTKFKATSAEKMEFPEKYFDAITCLGSLEHFIKPEVAIEKILKYLKKDGIIIIVLPNCWYIIDFIYRGLIRGESQTHGQTLERFYSKLNGNEFLEKNGLKVMQIRKYNPHNVPIPKNLKIRWARAILQILWKFLRQFIPTNVSYQFCYICRKDSS